MGFTARGGSSPLERMRRSLRSALAASRSGSDLDLRRRQHAKEVLWQPLARLPELQPDNRSSPRIEFAQSSLCLLRHNRARVIALKTHPGDIRVYGVVAVNPQLPGGSAVVAAPLAMAIKLLSLLQRMDRPPNRYGSSGTEFAGYRRPPSFLRYTSSLRLAAFVIGLSPTQELEQVLTER